jgi:hypothetical protein
MLMLESLLATTVFAVLFPMGFHLLGKEKPTRLQISLASAVFLLLYLLIRWMVPV